MRTTTMQYVRPRCERSWHVRTCVLHVCGGGTVSGTVPAFECNIADVTCSQPQPCCTFTTTPPLLMMPRLSTRHHHTKAHSWSTGYDQPFLRAVFAKLKAGRLGSLNHDQLIFRGWSGGAAMTSWMINLWAYVPLRTCSPTKQTTARG